MTGEERYLVAFITAGTAEEAHRIADTLVNERLAACVNVLPGCRSVYRWKGELQHDEEALMIVKTSRAALAGLEKRVLELHSYDVPEIIAVDLSDVSSGYLAFLRDSLSS
jgi:uncharacterized protein involved in tolerance to divalent cations